MNWDRTEQAPEEGRPLSLSFNYTSYQWHKSRSICSGYQWHKSCLVSGDKTASHKSAEAKAERLETAVTKIQALLPFQEDLQITHLPDDTVEREPEARYHWRRHPKS